MQKNIQENQQFLLEQSIHNKTVYDRPRLELSRAFLKNETIVVASLSGHFTTEQQQIHYNNCNSCVACNSRKISVEISASVLQVFSIDIKQNFLLT